MKMKFAQDKVSTFCNNTFEKYTTTWNRNLSISGKYRSPINTHRDRCIVKAGFRDGFKKFLDDIAFENWAPRSSRTWRLNLPPKEQTSPEKEEQDKEQGKVTKCDHKIALFCDVEELWNLLEEQVRKELENSETKMPNTEEDATIAEPSFMDSTDEEVSESLTGRIEQIAERSSDAVPQILLTGNPFQGLAQSMSGGGLGVELRKLIFQKWKRTYDVSFARRDFMGKTLVSLNIMWSYLEQGSFPMSEAQLMLKYQKTATYLNTWHQANRVREFLNSPPKSKGGLPSRPYIGVAVSFQLDLPPHIINEWFSRP